MNNKSFTLIELLVVIVIIGILAGVIMISTSSSIDKANLAKTQAFSSFVQEELLSNLVSELTFDEGSNQVINRVASNDDVKDTWGSNNGTVSGNPQIRGGSDCVSGKCLEFDGNGDYINCGNNNNLNFGIESFSISLWFKMNDISASFPRLLAKANSSRYQDTDGYCITKNTTSGQIVFAAGEGYEAAISKSTKSEINLFDNSWHNLFITFDKNNLKIYRDSNIDSTSNFLKDLTNSVNLIIGAASGLDGFFTGSLDEIRIYNAALSSSQIKQNYVAGLDSLLSNGNISKEDYDQRINALAYNKHE